MDIIEKYKQLLEMINAINMSIEILSNELDVLDRKALEIEKAIVTAFQEHEKAE